ncbi:MAG: 3-methyl-2-oxobutanoate hydroxymethyltransferase [Candidatus Pelagibacter sp.]|nr:3-methyl-2-oxobutanoate hydroxymethyltransferase [Candidatus Pelagibacter sp.]
MKNIYTWGAKPVKRTTTVADLKAAKGKKKFTQVTSNSIDEAAAAEKAGFDMIICQAKNVLKVREGSKNLFLTASLVLNEYVTEEDIMRGAFKALEEGADAVMTPRSMDIVEMLSKEDVPVMGHLGLVPRKSTSFGGLRAIGKTSEEALELFQKFKRLEDAGAFSAECEVIPENVMGEISKRTNIVTVSLGAGTKADVMYLFMEDICGESENPPRHAKAYGNILKLRNQIKSERVNALKAFKKESMTGKFPALKNSTNLNKEDFEIFLNQLD